MVINYKSKKNMTENEQSKPKTKYKTVKIEPETHKLLRIYAANEDLLLGEAIRRLLIKVSNQ